MKKTRSVVTMRCWLIAIPVFGGCGAQPPHAQPTQAETPVDQRSDISAPRERVTVETTAATAESLITDENNVYFARGITAVNEIEEGKLRRHAAHLKQNPAIKVTLLGHTDDLGSRNYNLAISEQRQLAVARILRSYGVPGKQIRRYRGDSEKATPACQSAECRQKMRRVELVYSH